MIFEDLDRFEDPQIFDSLRELNTLVNASANRQAGNEPLRFIYAIKDSLFERLGTDPESKDEKDAEEKLKDGEAETSDGQGSPLLTRNPGSTLLPRPSGARTGPSSSKSSFPWCRSFRIATPVTSSPRSW
ncbi:hypothetical protein [Paenarthrobacter sp. CAP02]|uniref:YobI family P-loop NTPase n=1 Tax=Paenarthrobacter sp. CAP02 TaxID=3158144 RepID=UPI0032DB42B6